MKHVARRGVCIGVDRHLKAGDPVPSDLDAAQVQFLVGIGAVEAVPDTLSVESDPVVESAPDNDPSDSSESDGLPPDAGEPLLGLDGQKTEPGKKKRK